MTDAANKVLEEALALPEEDQRWLAERLLESVPRDGDDVEEAWASEAVARLERAERGDAKLVSYDEVRERAQQLLRDK